MIRRWLPIVALVASTLTLLVAGWMFVRLADNDSQFCEVTAQRLVDKEDQVAQSKEYLASQAGQEPSGFNAYIRVVAVPRLRDEIRSDRRTLPADCRDEYQRLK